MNDKVKPIDLQNNTNFNPTAEQLVFADEYIKSLGNISEACKTMGNDNRGKYYRWTKEAGFSEWLSEYCKTEVLKRRGHWFLWLEKYAQSGSFQHLDRLLQIAKEFNPSGFGKGLNASNIHITYKYGDRLLPRTEAE